MKNSKTLLLGLVLLVGAAYLGAKAYVYFQAKSKLDEAIKQASLFADISYQGISSDLGKGSVSVDGLSIAPKTLQDVIEVREIKLQGDGPMFLFSDTSKMAQQTPEFLAVSMRGLRIGLDGELFRTLGQLSAAQAQAQGITLPASCEFGGSLTGEDLRELGYDALFANVAFTLSHDKIASKTRISVEMDAEDIADMEMTISMQGGSSPMMMAMAPKLDEVRLLYNMDGEYMKGVKKYCSSRLGMTEKAYIERMVNATDEEYQRFYGFIPGEGIRDAIRSFLQDPGEIDVRMRPSPDVNPAMLNQYRPQDIISLLGLNLYVNGQPVSDLSFTIDEKYSSLFGNQAYGEDKTEQEEAKRRIARYQFQVTPLAQLPQYIGAQVKMKTRDGKLREGTLVSVNRQTAQIEQRIHSGKFTVHVPIEQVSQFQVNRLLQEPEPE